MCLCVLGLSAALGCLRSWNRKKNENCWADRHASPPAPLPARTQTHTHTNTLRVCTWKCTQTNTHSVPSAPTCWAEQAVAAQWSGTQGREGVLEGRGGDGVHRGQETVMWRGRCGGVWRRWEVSGGAAKHACTPLALCRSCIPPSSYTPYSLSFFMFRLAHSDFHGLALTKKK